MQHTGSTARAVTVSAASPRSRILIHILCLAMSLQKFANLNIYDIITMLPSKQDCSNVWLHSWACNLICVQVQYLSSQWTPNAYSLSSKTFTKDYIQIMLPYNPLASVVAQRHWLGCAYHKVKWKLKKMLSFQPDAFQASMVCIKLSSSEFAILSNTSDCNNMLEKQIDRVG
jgi:hypothetical protein